MNRKRILLVDDEPGFTRLLKLLLERTGQYDVREENDGSCALETARAFNPDLILLDVIMPEMDGRDVAFGLRADPMLSATPIVFITAVLTESEVEAGKHVAGFPSLAKPIAIHKVIDSIEAQISQAVVAA